MTVHDCAVARAKRDALRSGGRNGVGLARRGQSVTLAWLEQVTADRWRQRTQTAQCSSSALARLVESAFHRFGEIGGSVLTANTRLDLAVHFARHMPAVERALDWQIAAHPDEPLWQLLVDAVWAADAVLWVAHRRVGRRWRTLA